MKIRLAVTAMAVLCFSLSACLKQERPAGHHHHHPHWNPKTKAEKHCYNEGFKPGSEEFQTCIKKYEGNIHWKKQQQEKQRDEQIMRKKAHQEKVMRRKAHQEKVMERKAGQQKRMREKESQEKWIKKKKKVYEKESK